MRDFFSEGGCAALGDFVGPRTLFAFDYDGTLAGLHPHPDDAILTAEIFARLEQLCNLAPVAILTGRSVADVRKFLPPSITRLVGNHGLEGVPAWNEALAKAQSAVNAWRPRINEELGRMPRVLFEDKAYSITLHAAEGSLERAALEHLAAALHPATRVILGKGVLNVVPADAPDKGSALRELMRMEGFDKAVFAGDDVTDEDVFALADPSIFGILVGPRALSVARWRLHPQERVRELLDHLIALAAADPRA